MSQTRLSYLREITDLLQAHLIMTPRNRVISFSPNIDVQLAFSKMSRQSANIDYAPIVEEGEVTGYVNRKDLVCIEEKTLGELARNIAPQSRISLWLCLESVLKLLVDEPLLFVTDNGLVIGIITRADVNKRAFGTFFYIVLSELESQLVNLIQTMLPCERHLQLLSEERAKDVLYNYWKAKTENAEISMEQYLSFSDIINIILKSKDMVIWSVLGRTSKKQVKNLTSLIDLRNRVMHSTRSLLTRDHSISHILQQYEHIWELLKNLREFETLDAKDIVSVTYDRKNREFRFVLKSGAVIRTPLDDINGKELETVGIDKITKFLESSNGRKKVDKTTMEQLRSTIVYDRVLRQHAKRDGSHLDSIRV